MKKFLSLLALMLLCSVGAWAQTALQYTELEAGVEYVFEHPTTQMYFNGDANKDNSILVRSIYVLELKDGTDNQYYIKRVADGKYVGTGTSDTPVMKDNKADAEAYTISFRPNNTNHVRFYRTTEGQTAYWLATNGSGNQTAHFQNSGDGEHSGWRVFKARECQINLPFTVTANKDENQTWYTIYQKNNNSNMYWNVANETQADLGQVKAASANIYDEGSAFCITGNFWDGFKIYNKKTGKGVTIASPTTDHSHITVSSSDATLVSLTMSGNEYYFYPKSATYSNVIGSWSYNDSFVAIANTAFYTGGRTVFTPWVAFPMEYVEDLAHIGDAKWYQMKVRNKWVSYDAVSNTFSDEADAQPGANAEASWFTFVGNPVAGFKIYSYAANKAFGADNANTDTRIKGVDPAQARTYIVKHVTYSENYGEWQIYDKATTAAYLNQQTTNMGYWQGGANGDNGNRFTFAEVAAYDDIEAVEYTMHDQNESVENFVVVKFQRDGSEFSTEVPAGGTYVSQTATGNVSPSNRTTTVTYTSEAIPFTPGLVYRLGVRPSGNNNTRYCGYRASDGKPLAEQNDDVEPCNEFAAENLWVFERVAGTANQFKLKNLAANAYLAGNGFNATGTAYTYAASSVNMGSIEEDGFTLANGQAVLGNHAGGDSGNENHQLGDWTATSTSYEDKLADPGSVFWVEAIDEKIPNLTNVGLARSTFLGVKQHPVNASAKETAAVTPNEANVKALFTVNFADCVSSSKYYRLANYETSRSGSNWVGTTTVAGPNGAILTAGRKAQSNVTDGGVAALWQFEESDGAYYLKNVNSGTCLFNSTANDAEVDLPIDKANAGTFALSNVSRQWWAVKTKTANEWLHQSNHADRKLLLWSGQPSLTGSQASLWSIEEVETLPLTIKTSKWASMCFPVAVTLPSELTAYYAVKVSTEGIGLAAIEGNIIPANTPVIVTTSEDLAAAKTYALTIGGEATAPEDNKFSGSTIPRQGYSETQYLYGLSSGSFHPINGTSVAANKAFIVSEENLIPSSSSPLRIYTFDDILTGISAVAAPAEQGAYYDLNGRMVAYPTTGVYVRNGKKIFVK